MTDPKTILQRLHRSLNILQERQAKHGLNVPPELIHEIEDHRTAIELTEQLAAGQVTRVEWNHALRPLLVKIEERGATGPISALNIGGVAFSQISGSTITTGDIDASLHAEGDVVGGAKVTQTAHGSNIAQASHGGRAEVNTSTFDQRKQQVSGDQYNAGRDIIIGWLSKPLVWLFGLAAVAIICIALVTIPSNLIALAPTPTVTSTPTITPTPTIIPTPLPFPPTEEGETLIVIATFEEVGDGQSLPHREIKNAIDRALTDLALNNPPRVNIHPEIIPAQDREAAEQLGQDFKASLIIWGTDTSARVTVNFLNLKDLESPVPEVQLDQASRSQLADPPAYAQYITQDLPNQLTFLSLFAIGHSFYLKTDYDAAITSLERAVRDVVDDDALPGLSVAYSRLGWLYQFPEKNPAEAIKYYSKAIELDPEYALAYNNRGYAYYQLGQYEQEIEDYTKAIEFDPEYALAYNNRGYAYYELGQYEQAVTDYTKAIELNPQDALAYNNRGIAYYYLGHYEQAIEDYTNAIDLDHDPLYWPYHNRGLVYSGLGQYEQAVADYTRAIDLNLEYVSAYNNRGVVYSSLGQYEQAVADYTKAINLDPEDALAYNNRGWAYYNLGQYEQAVADYTEAIELDPEDAFAYNNRGLAYYELEEYDKAIADYTKAIDLDPEDALAWPYNNRGWAYYNLGQYEQAIEDYTKAIDLDPKYALAYTGRGNVFAAFGYYEQAIEDYTKAIDLDPEDAYSHNARCWWGSLLNRTEDVMASCEQAVALTPDNGWIRDSRGLARALIGDYEGAIEDFRFFIVQADEDTSITPEEVEQRKQWISELEAGRNPFDEEMLREMREE